MEFAGSWRELCLEQEFGAEWGFGQHAGDFLRGMSISVRVLKVLDGASKMRSEGMLHGFQDFLSFRGYVENVGGMFASALPDADVQRRNSKRCGLNDAAAGVSQQQIHIF